MEALIAFVVVILILVIALGIFVAKWSKEDTENDLKDLEINSNDAQLAKAQKLLKQNENIKNLTDSELDSRL